MSKRPCPLCRREAIKDGNKFWPLCSERCHLIDLGKWLGEEYRVAGDPDPDALPAPPDDDGRERH
ncbi:MAG: DNA gyrase inhibitor YacG [Kofleriaceae bacterium]|nr:DNA gyrase inhibitor YacG [Kofleriaceae bacterium]